VSLPGDPGVAWGGRQGFRWTKTITVSAAGNPVTLDSYGVRFTLRHYFDTPGTSLMQFTRGDPQIEVDDDAGTITLTIDALLMRSIPDTLGKAPHEADLVLIPDGDEHLAFALLAGPWPQLPEVKADDDD
jgi:hypothetical protein